MQFFVDTHVHTSETSKCGRSTAAEMIAAYKNAGFGAVVISDHLNQPFSISGNCQTHFR